MKLLDEYQEAAARTRKPNRAYGDEAADSGLGVAGEAGEVADYLKKVVFHGHPLDVETIQKELGDILWYVADLATIHGLTLSEIATANIEKLKLRYPEGFSTERSVERED